MLLWGAVAVVPYFGFGLVDYLVVSCCFVDWDLMLGVSIGLLAVVRLF